MNSYCNPINIQYRYQHFKSGANREAADPTLIYYKDKYYLFTSMTAGFYYSDDMINWNYHENYNLDIYRYAPDVRQVGEYLYFCSSNAGEKSRFLRTLDPLSDNFELVSEPFPFWDPDLFYDDDGRAYLFWGCSNNKPIYGVEMNPETMMPKGKKKALICANPKDIGFEHHVFAGFFDDKKSAFKKLKEKIFGEKEKMPYFEGAYVNKFDGKYYLQYAAPGTEVSSYADGVYIADAPLGPYHFQSHNPYSSKPSGFITGAGHGSTIEDKYGNLWHASTMRISVNHIFERRIGIFPVGIDSDGILFCNQNFADYPLAIPDGKFDPMSIEPKWMLLSYKKTATASSSISEHSPSLAVNEDIRTWWCADGCENEWFMLDLEDTFDVRAVQINFADCEIPAMKVSETDRSGAGSNRRYIAKSEKIYTRYLLEGSVDGKNWEILADKRTVNTDLSHDYLVFEDGKNIRYIRITVKELPYNQKFALSGLRVFGNGNDEKPSQVKNIRAKKCADDVLCADVVWDKLENATGYNVRYGISPDKLYSSYLVYDENSVKITMLNRNSEYYVAVDSFNESGITKGEAVKMNG